MFAYLAFVYDSDSSTLSKVARQLTHRVHANCRDWLVALDVQGLIVYYKGARPLSSRCHLLDENSGVVLGSLFDRNTNAATSQGGSHPVSDISASGARWLIDAKWGSYVGFGRDARANRTWILRSPVGNLPCFRTMCDGIHIYFSRDFVDADPTARDIDWVYIASRMVWARESESTGLKGVWRIQPGECHEHSCDGLTKRLYWNPAEIACSDAIEDSADAAHELRAVTKSCIHAWASCYPGIVLNLSGGLDSSIVLGCLQDAPTRPRITCINHYSPGHRSDERTFARRAAEHAGCKLIEWPRESRIDMSGMLHISRYPEPQAYFRRIEANRITTKFARENGATALFSGDGGDQIFCQNDPRLAVADYLYRRHVRHMFRIAYDAAQLEGMSIWSVLGEAFREALAPYRRTLLHRVRPEQNLICAEKVDELFGQNMPMPLWLQSLPRIPPGKYRQLLALGPSPYYDALGMPDDPEYVAPLMSQPIVELCLRIPTYVSISGGWTRAVARKAFAPDVPVEILRRRLKGGIEEHLVEMWIHNIEFARELLLDGFLVREGLLDRQKLEVALSDRPSNVIKDLAAIFRYMCIEAWIRRMAAPAQRKAA